MWCLKRQNHLDHNSLKIVIIAVTKACILWECQLFGKNIEWFSISEKSQLLSFKYAVKKPFLQMVYLPLVLLHCHCVISYIAFRPLSGRAFCICRILVFAFTQGGRPTESQSWEYWERGLWNKISIWDPGCGWAALSGQLPTVQFDTLCTVHNTNFVHCGHSQCGIKNTLVRRLVLNRLFCKTTWEDTLF